MKFSELVGQVRDWLERERRVSYRALKREFDLTVLRNGCDRLNGNDLGLKIGPIGEPRKTDHLSGLAVFHQNDPVSGFFTNLIWRRFFPIHRKCLSYGVVEYADMGHANPSFLEAPHTARSRT